MRRFVLPVIVVLVLVLKVIVEERFFLGDYANGVPPILLLVPMLVIVGVHAWQRRWRHVAGYSAALLALLLLDWRPSFGRGEGPPQPGSQAVRFMTLNIFMQINGAERIAGMIRKYQPDIIAMQEADNHDIQGPKINRLKGLLPEYKFSTSGQMLTAVRGDIRRVQTAPITHNFPYRPLLLTQAVVKGKQVEVGNVHLVPQSYVLYMPTTEAFLPRLLRFGPAHLKQAQELTQLVPATGFLMGDFNHTPVGMAYRLFRSRWQDGFESGGRGLGHTIEIRQKFKRIDYILVPKGTQVLNAWVPEDVVSDHYAVIVDVARDSLP